MSRTFLLALAALAAALHAQDNPYSADARQSYALVKDSLLKAADRMPPEDYSFRTTPKVRTFGEGVSTVDSPVKQGNNRRTSVCPHGLGDCMATKLHGENRAQFNRRSGSSRPTH
jgi:hypothetical protein